MKSIHPSFKNEQTKRSKTKNKGGHSNSRRKIKGQSKGRRALVNPVLLRLVLVIRSTTQPPNPSSAFLSVTAITQEVTLRLWVSDERLSITHFTMHRDSRLSRSPHRWRGAGAEDGEEAGAVVVAEEEEGARGLIDRRSSGSSSSGHQSGGGGSSSSTSSSRASRCRDWGSNSIATARRALHSRLAIPAIRGAPPLPLTTPRQPCPRGAGTRPSHGEVSHHQHHMQPNQYGSRCSPSGQCYGGMVLTDLAFDC